MWSRRMRMESKIYSRDDLLYIACLIDRGGVLGINIDTRKAASSAVKFSFSISKGDFLYAVAKIFGGKVTKRLAISKNQTKDMYTYQLPLNKLSTLLPQVLPHLRTQKARKLVILVLKHMEINLRGRPMGQFPDLAQKKFDIAMDIRDMIRGIKP
jgi:hypothetical protein